MKIAVVTMGVTMGLAVMVTAGCGYPATPRPSGR